MQAVTVYKGVVKMATKKVFDSKFNDQKRMNITVSTDSGDITIWGHANGMIKDFETGDAIEFAKNGNEYIILDRKANAKTDTATKPTNYNQSVGNSLKWQQPSKDIKQSMLDYTAFQSKVYLHIFKSVSTDFADMALKDSELKDISTTIFIQTQRKFNF